MLLSPSAAGTTKAPPLIGVPAGAVRVGVWHVAQPISPKILSPASASAPIGPRGGAWSSALGERRHVDPVVLGLGNLVVARAEPDEEPVRGVLLGQERARDAHLVQVGVGGEGLEAR